MTAITGVLVTKRTFAVMTCGHRGGPVIDLTSDEEEPVIVAPETPRKQIIPETPTREMPPTPHPKKFRRDPNEDSDDDDEGSENSFPDEAVGLDVAREEDNIEIGKRPEWWWYGATIKGSNDSGSVTANLFMQSYHDSTEMGEHLSYLWNLCGPGVYEYVAVKTHVNEEEELDCFGSVTTHVHTFRELLSIFVAVGWQEMNRASEDPDIPNVMTYDTEEREEFAACVQNFSIHAIEIARN